MARSDRFTIRSIDDSSDHVPAGTYAITASDRHVRLVGGPDLPEVVLNGRRALIAERREWRFVGRKPVTLVGEDGIQLVETSPDLDDDAPVSLSVRRNESTIRPGPHETVQLKVASGEMIHSGEGKLATVTINHKLSIPKSRAGNQYAALEGEVLVIDPVSLGQLTMVIWLTAGSKWARKIPWVGVRHVPPRDQARGP